MTTVLEALGSWSRGYDVAFTRRSIASSILAEPTSDRLMLWHHDVATWRHGLC